MTTEDASGQRPTDGQAADQKSGKHKPRAPGMRALLDALCDGDPNDKLALRDLVGGLGRGAFGVLLLIATLPAFIPIPAVAGALSGPLVTLAGLQLLILSRKPWLPKFLAERGPQRATVVRFDRAVSPWLRRLEKMVRPRLLWMIDHPLAMIVTGALLLVLGVLLWLPIPLTNFLFGGLLLLFALALLERDGILMLIAWATGAVTAYTFGAVSIGLILKMMPWLATLG